MFVEFWNLRARGRILELRFASMFLVKIVDLALWCAVAYIVVAYLSSVGSCVPGANIFKSLQIFTQFIFLILFFLLLISDTKELVFKSLKIFILFSYL